MQDRRKTRRVSPVLAELVNFILILLAGIITGAVLAAVSVGADYLIWGQP